jgi:ribosome biogenesis GTPase A
MNFEILRTVRQKPVLLLFHKSDLADDKVTEGWIRHYRSLGYETLKIDAVRGTNVQSIMRATSSILKEKRDKRAAAGLKPKPVRTMILGIPNVGKSTLINRLANRASTRTANTPGVTKAQQWIKVGETFELLDTPGVLWPKFDDPEVGMKLAATGAIKDSILPIHDVAMYITDVMISHYPERLKARYGITEISTASALHAHIGNTRGALAKGGGIDQDRVNRIIISDLRNNKFGGVSFDRTP